MSNAIKKSKSGLTICHAALGYRAGAAGSVKQQVHDGDTINVRAVGNFGVRFLGVDAPEISFMLPGESKFTGLSNAKWELFLSDPFSHDFPPFDPPLDQGLINYIQIHAGAGAAINQHDHATAAEDALEEEVLKDLEVLGKNEDDFQFFLAFAFDIMDRYGRLLCFINRHQPDPADPEPRPFSYNQRLLQKGLVNPYFIWPNINPFRAEKSIADAAYSPVVFRDKVNDGTLSLARQWVREARERKRGIFDENNPLRLEPFEVRFLAQRRPPNRWVIDLSKNDDILIKPQEYFTISNAEDRLYIPPEYVPLFVKSGWRL